MAGTQHIYMTTEYDKIYFSLQYSHHSPIILIENSYFQIFQEDCHELYNPMVEWLDKTYLESSVANNKFRSSLTLFKEFGVG